MAKNVCECPKPPGGRAVCEIHQLAICRIVDGQVHTECINPPAYLNGDLVNDSSVGSFDAENSSHLRWALEIITGGEIGAAGVESLPGVFGMLLSKTLSDEERLVLTQGEWINPRTGETVKFRLPANAEAKYDFLEADPGVGSGEEGS